MSRYHTNSRYPLIYVSFQDINIQSSNFRWYFHIFLLMITTQDRYLKCFYIIGIENIPSRLPYSVSVRVWDEEKKCDSEWYKCRIYKRRMINFVESELFYTDRLVKSYFVLQFLKQGV